MKREEIAKALDEIRDEYLEEADLDEKPCPRHIWMKKTIPLVACFALILTAALSMPGREEGTDMALPEMEQAQNGSSDMNSQAARDDRGESYRPMDQADGLDQDVKKPLPVNDVILNAAAVQDILLPAEDFVALGREELLNYYGTTLPVEEVLPELHAIAGDWGVYRRKAGAGAAYQDYNTFSYSDGEGKKGVDIALSRAAHPMLLVPEPGERKPLQFASVNGRELVIFRSGAQYYVEWMQEGIGWRVGARGLAEDEFSALLTALVEPEASEHQLTGTVKAVDPAAHRLGIDGDGDLYYSVVLPEETDPSRFSLGDRIKIIWRGEPALLQTLWAEQLISVEAFEVEGA